MELVVRSCAAWDGGQSLTSGQSLTGRQSLTGGQSLNGSQSAGLYECEVELVTGRTHQVVTGVCLLHLRNHRQAVFAETTAVTFHPLKTAKIRRYLKTVNPLDKAGAYAIQEQGDLIVKKIAGSYTNVVGLPLERLAAELETWAAT